uniref:TIL domain-containing protein n=1 Tax=Glossina pallidipes TaxID=7398 RepID=A0A1B0AAA6_GLOPL
MCYGVISVNAHAHQYIEWITPPALDCGPNEEYAECGGGCQPECGNPYTDSCGQACVMGCGYVEQNTSVNLPSFPSTLRPFLAETKHKASLFAYLPGKDIKKKEKIIQCQEVNRQAEETMRTKNG